MVSDEVLGVSGIERVFLRKFIMFVWCLVVW